MDETSKFQVRFKFEKLNAHVKRASISVLELLSFIGGILGMILNLTYIFFNFMYHLSGLCTGASVLTVVELFYFFFFLQFTKNLTTLKVHPINLNTNISQASQKSSVIKFLMGFMENSSIHSFNFMKTEKHKIEK